MMEAVSTKSVPWYSETVPPIDPAMRELLVQYAGIEDSAVEKHLTDVRDEAWRVSPFPCVGTFLFADLALSTFPIYPTVLENLRSGAWTRYLDVGCGLGQDLRKLVHDGAPASAVLGTDLSAGLLTSGQALFRDADALPLGTSLLTANFLDEGPDNALAAAQLDGSVDVVHASMFLHCFDLSTQLRACRRIVRLLKPEPGVMVVGKTGGVAATGRNGREEVTKGPVGSLGGVAVTSFLHDVNSFQTLWEEVGRESGTKWEVEAAEEEVRDAGNRYFDESDHRWVRFVVTRK